MPGENHRPVIRCRTSKDRHYNDKMKHYKRTNNNLQKITTQKIKDYEDHTKNKGEHMCTRWVNSSWYTSGSNGIQP